MCFRVSQTHTAFQDPHSEDDSDIDVLPSVTFLITIHLLQKREQLAISLFVHPYFSNVSIILTLKQEKKLGSRSQVEQNSR